jgi:gas vesicle protein
MSHLHDETDETDETQHAGSNTLAWFLTGAIIGATAAALYTPKSGKETRRFISDKTQQGKEAVEETSHDIAEASRDMFERGRRLVDDAADLFDRGRKLVKG